MIIRNEDISPVIVEIPAGHRHLRTTVSLAEGTDLVFQEAAIANIVRVYVSLKTHPMTTRYRTPGGNRGRKKRGLRGVAAAGNVKGCRSAGGGP